METTSCVPLCGTTAQTTDIPGSQGGNAYTVTTANFIVPAANNNVTVAVADTAWMIVGQIVVTPGPYNFEVISVNSAVSVTLEWLDYSADAATGATVASGAGVSPSGQQSSITATPAIFFALLSLNSPKLIIVPSLHVIRHLQ